MERLTIRPQAGPQSDFLASPADIVVYGGAAGGGKTWALLMEPLRHIHNPEFDAVIFRRTYPQVTNPGGLWDESERVYPLLGAKANRSGMRWVFPSGATVRFAHMQHDADRYSWQGAQIPLICFDELTHFSLAQFLYMLSRNRSTSGVRPYMRATTNPDADSWVKEFLGPWVDAEHAEFPFPAARLRWFTQESGKLVWVEQAWRDEMGQGGRSLTFVPARVTDNQILLAQNPEYVSNLRALPYVEQQRLLHGDWAVRPEAGKVFNRAWFGVAEAAPAGGVAVRFWDLAATAKKSAGDDPDYAVGVKLRRVAGRYFVEDVRRERAAAAEVERLIINTARQDGADVRVGWEVEPGSSGKMVASRLSQLLSGFACMGVRPTGDKLQRANPVAAQALAGNVDLVRGQWNGDFLGELHGFPDLPHDDQVDGLSGAFNVLASVADGGLVGSSVVSRAAIAEMFG